jgi:hypothetical protein
VLLNKIKLNSSKCSAAKNAIKNGDILLSINNIVLPVDDRDEDCYLTVQKIFNDAMSHSTMKLSIRRDDKELSFTIKTKNHGIEIEIIDPNKIEKEKKIKDIIEKQKQQDIKKAEEIKLAVERQKENYRLSNKNKTIILSSQLLRQFFVFQFSPKEPCDLNLKEQIEKLITDKKISLFIKYKDIKCEVIFDTLDNRDAEFGLQFSESKMLSLGYVNINDKKVDKQSGDNDEEFVHDAPSVSIVLYFIATLLMLCGFFIYSVTEAEYGVIFLLLGILTGISYVWFGKVLSYLDAIKYILLKKS